MSLRKYILLFIIQFLGAPLAIFSFRYIEPKFFAAVVASFGFICIGGFVSVMMFKWRRDFYKSPIFISSVIFLFFIALPMFLGRMAFRPEVPFKDIHFLLLNGNEFHQLATFYYRIMLLLTLLEGGIYWVQRKRKKA